MKNFENKHTKDLEEWIAEYSNQLPPPEDFIIPVIFILLLLLLINCLLFKLIV